MATFSSKLIKKEEIALGSMEFHLEKPEGITYIPGQHATFRIINPKETDQEGDSRTFSFVSIPSDNEIAFATRIRDTAFKRNLKNAEPGLQIEISNPRGSMILPNEAKRPLILLAGGIGITPFIGMIKQATETGSAQKIFLFHSNKTKEEAQFFDRLKELAEKNPNFIFIPTLTEQEWDGEKGRVSADMIKKYIGELQDKIYYTAGPIAMVNAMTDLLTQNGIESIFIKSEDFGEYK